MKKAALKVVMASVIVFPLIAGGILPAAGKDNQSSMALAESRIKVENGMTQPIFSLDDAIVERVFVETATDSDGDGKLDRIRADIIRPKETEEGLKVPVIYEMSPYRSGIKGVPVYDVDTD